MDYTYLPTLEHLALTRTIIVLWHQKLIKNIAPLHFDAKNAYWSDTEEKIKENVLKFELPKHLKERLISSIKPIGLEIFNWMDYYNHSELGIELPDELCWSPQGIIDYKKTAELIVRNDNLDVTKRFRLACLNCLEDDIPKLWKELKIPQKFLFCREEDLDSFLEHKLVYFWAFTFMGKEDKWYLWMLNKRSTPNLSAFEFALADANKPAIAYFLQRLTPEERDEGLVKFASTFAERRMRFYGSRTKHNRVDILAFLLKEMTEEQQIEAFKQNPYDMLLQFLSWPYQDLFMQTARRICGLFHERDFYSLLCDILCKIETGSKDYNYRELFRQFWKLIPKDVQKILITEKVYSDKLLTKLFRIEDKENIKLIFKNVSAMEREKFIFSDVGKDICEWLMCSRKIDLLIFFFHECLLNRDKFFKLKKEFKIYLSDGELNVAVPWKRIQVWLNLVEVIDDLIDGKREF